MIHLLCNIPRLILISSWTLTHMLLCFNYPHVTYLAIRVSNTVSHLILISICFPILSMQYHSTTSTLQYAARFETLQGVTILPGRRSLWNVP